MESLQKEISKLYECVLDQNKKRSDPPGTGRTSSFRDLNIEGAEAYQNASSRSLAIHISNYSAVLHFLKQYLFINEPFKILELGCGSGLFSSAFLKLLEPKVSLTAGDYNKDLVTYATKVFAQKNLEFKHLDALKIPLKFFEGVKVVFFCELWEHLLSSDQKFLLQRLHCGLDKDALVLFTTPDLSAYKRGRSNYYAHKKEYKYRELKCWLEDDKNNPFREYQVSRLINSRLTRDLVMRARCFGFFFNTLYKSLYNLSLKSAFTKEGLLRLNALYYKLIGRIREPKIPKEYFETYLADSDSSEYDSLSFSLLVKLER